MRTLFLATLIGLGASAGCSDSPPTTAPAGTAQPAQPNPPAPDGKPGQGRIPPPPK